MGHISGFQALETHEPLPFRIRETKLPNDLVHLGKSLHSTQVGVRIEETLCEWKSKQIFNLFIPMIHFAVVLNLQCLRLALYKIMLYVPLILGKDWNRPID